MTLMRYHRPNSLWQRSAFEGLSQLQDEFQRLFEGTEAAGCSQAFNTWAPALDMYEDGDNLIVTLEVPGMKREAFDVALHEGVLSISGERKLDEKRENASRHRAERFEGRFQRSVALPKAVKADQVKAAYRDGILTVTLPVAEEARPRQIAVATE